MCKYEVSARLAKCEKQALEHTKALAKEVEKVALAGAAEAAKALEPGKPAVVRLDFGNNGKLNSGVMKALGKGCKGGAFLVVSLDLGGDAVCVYASVPKDQMEALDGLKWCEAALAPLGGGKCGGKAMNAMGSASGAAKVEEVVAAAKAFLA